MSETDLMPAPDTLLAPRRVLAPEGQTLAAIISAHFPDPILKAHAVVMIDGEIIPADQHLGYNCRAGENVQVALRPSGGGAKKVLRTVLTIAVVVVATWITGGLGGAGLIGALGKTGAAFAAAAFTVAGNFAINSLLPPPGLSSARTEVDPTYTLSGTRNQARPGQVLPVVIGRHRFTPDLITEQYQDIVGDDTHLRFGICVGAGNYEVEDIRIGDTPIEEFGNIRLQRSLTIDSPPQTLFPGDVTQTPVGLNFEDSSYRTRVTRADAEDIDIILDFPRGLGTTDDDGDPSTVSVTMDIQYREVTEDGEDDAEWRDIAVDNGADADAALEEYDGIISRRDYWPSGNFSNLGAFYNNLPAAGGTNTSRTFSRRDFKPFSTKIRISVPPGKQYEVSVRRRTPRDADVGIANDVSWRSLNTWSARDIAPDPRFATMWFQIPATDELSGFIDSLNARVSKIIPTLDVDDPENFDPALITSADWTRRASTSQNAADVYLDAIRGPHTDNPTPDDEINFASVAAFWKWCHLNNYTFNLPILQTLSRGEVEQMICAVGRGRPFRFGREKRITIDRPRTEGAKQFLTATNARNFQFLRNFSNPVHGLRITFSNEENDNEEDEMIVYADGFSAANATLFEETSLPGETNPDQVYAKGYYILQTALRANLTGSCEMDIEADTLQLGDLVRLTAPTLNRAVTSARVLQTDGLDIVLTESVEMDPALNYVLRHRRPVTVDGVGQLDCDGIYPLNTRPAGDVVTLSSALPDGVEIKEDDAVIIGIAGEDSFEGLVRNINATGPYQADIEFVSYLPDRLTVPNIPAHVPAVVRTFTTPAAPVFLSYTISNDFVTVNFDVSNPLNSRIASFRAAWRFTPADDVAPVWNVISDVAGGVRSVSFPVRHPSDHYDLRIAAIDYDGVSSPVLLVSDMSSSVFVPAPANVTATPYVRTNASGIQIPIVEISFDPVNPEVLETFVVEARAAGTADAFAFAYQVTSELPIFDIATLTPGGRFDLRFYWRNIHGAVTDVDIRPIISDVQIADSFVAGDSVMLGGLPAGNFVGLLSEATGVPATNRRIQELRDAALAENLISGQIQEVTAAADNANANYEEGLSGYYSFAGGIPSELPNYCIVGRLKIETEDNENTAYEQNQAQENIQGAVLLETMIEDLLDAEQ